jgi:CubicO group peptidase (beta-lactamase class C family)
MKIDPTFVDGVARKTLEAFGAPGVSIALVGDGAVVSRAYGLADVSTGQKLTPDTAFTLASATKSFTALAMSILREEGALDWDDPVSRLAGDLCSSRTEEGRPVTIRDILSHQAGFGWHDPLWYNSPWDRTAVIRRAWQAGPGREPRTCFQYCNLMYMLAGEIVARVSGMSYESFVRSRILEPLGMASAHFSNEAPPHGCPVARPHVRNNGVLRPIAFSGVSKANAACGLRVSARDMAMWLSQYIQPCSNSIPAHAFKTVIAPQVSIRPLEGARFYALFGQPDWLEYGFGWFLRRYRGHRVIFHTGRLPGAGAHVAVLPDLGFAIVALTNLTLACLAEALAFALLDRLVGGPETDWLSYYTGVSKELESAAKAPAIAASESSGACAPSEADKWTGDYVDPAYGRIQARKRQDTLRFAWANYRGDLLPLAGTKFSLMNLDCPLLADGEIVEFQDEGAGALLFLERRFERIAVCASLRSPVEGPLVASLSRSTPVLEGAG